MRELEKSHKILLEALPSSLVASDSFLAKTLAPRGVHEGLPKDTLYEIPKNADYVTKTTVIANYLRRVTTLEWQATLLSTVIKGAVQRNQEGGIWWV